MFVWLGIQIWVYACIHVFSRVWKARRQFQIPFLVHYSLLFFDTGSLSDLGVTKSAGWLASITIPASPALRLQAHTTSSLFHMSSGVQSQVLILTSQTLCWAITPACRLFLYIPVFKYSPILKYRRLGFPLGMGKGMILPVTHSF